MLLRVSLSAGAGQQLGSEHRSKSLTRKATPWLGSLVTEAEPSTQHAEHAEHASLGQIEEGPEEAEEAGEGEQPKGVRFEEGERGGLALVQFMPLHDPPRASAPSGLRLMFDMSRCVRLCTALAGGLLATAQLHVHAPLHRHCPAARGELLSSAAVGVYECPVGQEAPPNSCSAR